MNNSKSKLIVQDHIKTQTNNMKNDSKTQIKDELNLGNMKKKKKSIIQGLKILNTNKLKKAYNNNEDYYTSYSNNNKFVEISDLNSSRNENKKNKNNLNTKKGSLNTEEENDYFKEISNIMYEYNTEPRTTIQYNTKEKKDKKMSLSKGRVGQIKEKKKYNAEK
jgi:hypothetical protein